MRLAAPLAWNLVAEAYTDEYLPFFEVFARRALDLAGVAPGERVLDVACGSGALTMLAAARGARVTALDFSDEMLARLRRRAEGLVDHHVVAMHGDGQALPFADQCFDAGFSMFGLLFFPDRARGFSELRRVVRPGGTAVVSSWLPLDDNRIYNAVFSALFELAPELTPSSAPPVLPLSSADLLRQEMEAAGFTVQVEVVASEVKTDALAEMIHPLPHANAPLALMRQQLGVRRFDEAVWPVVEERVEAELGPGPIGYTMSALLGVGRVV